MSADAPREARAEDRGAVLALLREAALPDDLEGWYPHDAAVVERDGAVIGVAGFERAGEDVLLRSVVVAPRRRGRGVAAALVAERLEAARRAGARRAFLLTTDAGAWFRRRGFAPVAREAAPAAIAATRQFAGLCPASAALLVRDLADG